MRWLLLLLAFSAQAQVPVPLDPLVEYRYKSSVLRKPDGRISRDVSVVAAFRRVWVCPATGKHTGPCPGWAVDHVVPLAACGKDEVLNLQWLPQAIKSCGGSLCKDRWERKVYQCPRADGTPNASGLPLPQLGLSSEPVLSETAPHPTRGP